jgi:hypothetical protein
LTLFYLKAIESGMAIKLPKNQAARTLLALSCVLSSSAISAAAAGLSEQETVAICPTVHFERYGKKAHLW